MNRKKLFILRAVFFSLFSDNFVLSMEFHVYLILVLAHNVRNVHTNIEQTELLFRNRKKWTDKRALLKSNLFFCDCYFWISLSYSYNLYSQKKYVWFLLIFFFSFQSLSMYSRNTIIKHSHSVQVIGWIWLAFGEKRRRQIPKSTEIEWETEWKREREGGNAFWLFCDWGFRYLPIDTHSKKTNTTCSPSIVCELHDSANWGNQMVHTLLA